jgi:hypothetical protein
MKLKDVPLSPAYLVFHDAYDNGAMEVWPADSFELAQKTAASNQDRLENLGQDECGGWKAYEKLPRVRVWKYHPERKADKCNCRANDIDAPHYLDCPNREAQS